MTNSQDESDEFARVMRAWVGRQPTSIINRIKIIEGPSMAGEIIYLPEPPGIFDDMKKIPPPDMADLG